MRRLRMLLVALLIAAVPLVSAGPARAELDPEMVSSAIDKAVRALKRMQNEDGTWDSLAGLYDTTPLCTLALLNAGVSPRDDHIRRALAHIRKGEPSQTYVVALETMVLCIAEPEKDLEAIRRNALWLASVQKTTDGYPGTWGYPGGSGDNSNTQFALLGLYEAERTLQRYGVKPQVPPRTWQLALAHWKNTQNPDGSWGYQPGRDDQFSAGTGSMTCAGIASLIIASDRLSQGAARVEGNTVKCCGSSEDDAHLQAALDWMGRNFSTDRNPGDRAGRYLYYLYAMERVGRLSAQRFFVNRRDDSKYDWYREGAEKLVKRSMDLNSGTWIGEGHGESVPHVGTSFALLFLAKGRRPVLLGKLQYGPPRSTAWKRHPHDAANLTHYVEMQWKRDLTWQVIDADAATADDYQQAPVLYLSGNEALDLLGDGARVKALREYLDRGGFLFAEACCENSEAFDRSFRQLIDEQVYPEPEFRLRQLQPDHEVWFIEENALRSAYAGHLYGVDVGCRTNVIYCDTDLSCYWELSRAGRGSTLPVAAQQQVNDALAVGINVLAYATNRELKYKYEIPATAQQQEGSGARERMKLIIAKARHSGGWNSAPGALPRLQRELNRHLGILVPTDQREVELGGAELFNYHMVFMHGRNAFRLSDEQREHLKLFVERGGLVFADAVCASEAFARSFRQEMTEIFGRAPERIPGEHKMFTAEYGGFDLATVTRRDPPRGRRGNGPLKAIERQVPPELEGLKFEDDRYGVIFSPYDLSCALENHEAIQCRGYTRDDAARIGINVVLYSLHE